MKIGVVTVTYNRQMKNKGWIIRAYLFVLLVLLPLDWFTPTGKLFREFGAKPAAPLLVLGAVLLVLSRSVAFYKLSKPTVCAAFSLALIVLFGSIAFWLNLIFSWSDFGQAKNPIVQFVAQLGIFLLFVAVVVVHAQFFERAQWRDFILAILPTVVVIHLVVFFLEAGGIVSPASGWLSLFRTAFNIDRPSGLMSEPAYFGTFAALYGFPLLVIRFASKRLFRYLLVGILFTAAVLIRAKTFVPVVVLQLVIFIWHQGRAAFRLRYVAFAALLLLASAYMVISNAVLDLQENLSSVMRIGSTVLALNVAGHGYGLTGIGFGQFHFFYRAEYAPNFILSSVEARNQMLGSSEFRASTYNLFARLLVETGVLGLTAFLSFLLWLFRKVSRDNRPATLFGLLLVAGSLGFLSTQDSYFYPPLAVGLALLLGSATDLPAAQALAGVAATDKTHYAS